MSSFFVVLRETSHIKDFATKIPYLREKRHTQLSIFLHVIPYKSPSHENSFPLHPEQRILRQRRTAKYHTHIYTSFYLELVDNTLFHSKTNKVLKRDYSNYNRSALIEYFRKIDWPENLQDLSSVDDIYETFFAVTNDIVNRHIPLKQMSRKAAKLTAKLWITSAIKTSIV